jgi:hypothetical protein
VRAVWQFNFTGLLAALMNRHLPHLEKNVLPGLDVECPYPEGAAISTE